MNLDTGTRPVSFSSHSTSAAQTAPTDSAPAASVLAPFLQARGLDAFSPAVPPGTASAAKLDAVLDALHVETNPKYRPTGTPGTAGRVIHCNQFAQDALKGLGVPNVPMGNANAMNTFFNSRGSGWRPVSAAEAQQLANQGRACVASWKNPSGGHGHIGVIRPGTLVNGSPAMAQAGGHVFNHGTVKRGFGSKHPQLFVYEGAQRSGPSARPTSRAAVTGPGRDDLGGFRSTKYDPLIKEMAAKYAVPARLIKSVIEQESKFIPSAGSKAGALGLMQLMPATARELGVRNRLDPRQSVEGGTKYLARMLRQFKGNVPLALAAYNSGPGNVLKYHGIPPFKETRVYVRNITASYGAA